MAQFNHLIHLLSIRIVLYLHLSDIHPLSSNLEQITSDWKYKPEKLAKTAFLRIYQTISSMFTRRNKSQEICSFCILI